MKMDFVFKQLVKKLGAIPMAANVGNKHLLDTEELIAGFYLCDSAINYKLLTEYDLLSLPKEQREWCTKKHLSPFDNILLIFYKNEKKKPTFRIINGMASQLFLGLCEIWETIEVD